MIVRVHVFDVAVGASWLVGASATFSVAFSVAFVVAAAPDRMRSHGGGRIFLRARRVLTRRVATALVRPPLFFNAWSTNSREKASLVDDEGLKRAQSSYVAKSTFLLILITHLYDAHPRRVVSRLIVINVARRERLPKRRQKPRARSLCVRHANLGKHP